VTPDNPAVTDADRAAILKTLGLSFPVWTWNGTRYVRAGREVSDAELSKMKPTYLP
jgi:hypothetical protein